MKQANIHLDQDSKCQSDAVITTHNGLFVYGPGMFAGQSDVIITSDVTSGVHPPNAFFNPWYSGSLSRIHYRNVRRRGLLLPGIYIPSYPFACAGMKLRTFRMP